ncbi:MAG: undecaprenyl-phosphate glucose phosphotransferase [Bacteroidetes bacterium]|nr:undecaprenyl-phosphate glucose phosphotransferase [Bacteroidota bacterium]
MLINQKSIQSLRIFSDLIIINISFLAAGVLAQSLQILLDRNFIFILLLLLNLIWFFTSRSVRLYQDLNYRPFSLQIIQVSKVVFVQLLFSVLFIFSVKEDLFTRNFILFNSAFVWFLVLSKEYSVRKWVFSQRKKHSLLKKILIVGTGELSESFKEFIENNSEFGFGFAGYISVDGSNGENILGDFDKIEEIIQTNNINDVVIAIPSIYSEYIEKSIKICDKNAVNSYIIPEYFKFLSSKFQINYFGDFPIITVRNNPLDEIQWRLLKRVFDIVFSFFVIVFVLWWLFPVISILIKLTSKGPVLFLQDRVGTGNKHFKCYKFRTMRLESSLDNKSNKIVTKGDSRITEIGSVLRKTNLDEILQFWNVLKGDMSVVGPRPHPIPFNDMYSEFVEEIKLRHRVKPGITGWAQIHGLRGDVDDYEENKLRAKKRIKYDIWYIENWTFGLDIRIIFDTVIQIFTGKNRGF